MYIEYHVSLIFLHCFQLHFYIFSLFSCINHVFWDVFLYFDSFVFHVVIIFRLLCIISTYTVFCTCLDVYITLLKTFCA